MATLYISGIGPVGAPTGFKVHDIPTPQDLHHFDMHIQGGAAEWNVQVQAFASMMACEPFKSAFQGAAAENFHPTREVLNGGSK